MYLIYITFTINIFPNPFSHRYKNIIIYHLSCNFPRFIIFIEINMKSIKYNFHLRFADLVPLICRIIVDIVLMEKLCCPQEKS